MHNPSLTVDDNDMNENFQTVLDLFEDQYLSQHLEKHFTADEVHKSLNKVIGLWLNIVCSIMYLTIKVRSH